MTPAKRQAMWQLKKRIRQNGRKYPGPDCPGCGLLKVLEGSHYKSDEEPEVMIFYVRTVFGFPQGAV
jgi:hypothetical protein